MHDIRQVEEILGRLMPVAMSEGGQAEIEQQLDEWSSLTGQAQRGRSKWWYWGTGTGIAAGVALALFWNVPGTVRPQPAQAAVAGEMPGMCLIGNSNRLESVSDEGWMEDEDGATMQAVRLNVVEENTVHDEETGIVMSISEPREEYLFMPVTTF